MIRGFIDGQISSLKTSKTWTGEYNDQGQKIYDEKRFCKSAVMYEESVSKVGQLDRQEIAIMPLTEYEQLISSVEKTVTINILKEIIERGSEYMTELVDKWIEMEDKPASGHALQNNIAFQDKE